MENRTCSICGNEYPLTKDHFRWRVKDGSGHFTAECRLCIKNEAKRAAERRKAKRESALRKIEDAGVDAFLRTAAAGGSNIPHSAEVIERVFDYFGGVSGFSAVLVKQYWDSPPGGSARNRLLETMCRLVSKNVEQGGAKKPLALWSEEELEEELNKRFEQAVAVVTGAVIHVEETEPAKRLTSQEAEKASDIHAAIAAFNAGADPVRARPAEGTAKRVEGSEVGGPASLPTEPESGEDSRLPSE